MDDAELLDAATRWQNDDTDEDTRSELEALIAAHNIAELRDRFSSRLSFGTAGLRGLLGAGPNRMNATVVAQTTAGLADYLIATVDGATERGVVIGYDGRRKSRQFSEEAASILLAKGFKVYLSDDTVPTPCAAFAVLHYGAAAGIVVTASHNPPDYNGYKVYWGNGAQIIPPHDIGIEKAIRATGDAKALSRAPLEAARKQGLLVSLDAEVENLYIDEVLKLRCNPAAPTATNLVIAYTPLHGVGARFIAEVMSRAGYNNVHVVEAQREPDGSFPTVEFPNPEEDGAMDLVIELGIAVDADLVLANDPDTDRLAAGVRTGGSYTMLTGDQLGILLADYLLKNGPNENCLVASSIVSSQLLEHLAAGYGATYKRTLTGFKWIANTALDHSAETGSRFVMGYEEALGYSVGELVRDKDGVSAALLFAELAALAKADGKTPLDLLEDIYRRFGVYVTRQVSLVRPGASGSAEISKMMEFSRTPLASIGEFEVDVHSDLSKDGGDLPPSNLVLYKLSGGNRVLVRPSGTEPKLKSYYEVREAVADGEPLSTALARATERLESLASAHQAMLASSTEQ